VFGVKSFDLGWLPKSSDTKYDVLTVDEVIQTRKAKRTLKRRGKTKEIKNYHK